ncbi:MAG: 1-(5-phosphoribosyl)-5-[(5-phosphoribosylamino)methylideneamino] imidazole-4-carboxamide isomerase [Bryobacterales bacterium]|nr:1-(5-phosphoribosyl)-5-[(5-phosphoribosylamino)methylideneamino] imidazole-4-carboxamide isomerase [Bryobacterales bacterium]
MPTLPAAIVIPCIDLMESKVVQLVQGREKALEGDHPHRMLERFAGFPVIQVIDLDAALGKGENDAIVEDLATRARIRAGGGVRSPQRAAKLVSLGVDKVIVGTAAFNANGIREDFLAELAAAVGTHRVQIALDSKNGRIVVRGWQESTELSAVEVLRQLEPYCSSFLCTYVDKEGMMQGTDLDWFASLRAGTGHEITAAGGVTTLEDVRALLAMNVNAALGMAIYTGSLSLDDLRAMLPAEPPSPL